MKVLIACEESQTVCKAFREKGHEAYSCDILKCSGGHPEWHIQGDVIPILNGDCTFQTSDTHTHTQEGRWDLIIAHPPCTYLTVSANKYYEVSLYGEGARLRQKERYKAIVFFMEMIKANCDRIAVENPVGIMSTAYKKPDQIIQPYEYGDHARKATCLWLKGLNKLTPTKIVDPGEILHGGYSKNASACFARDKNGKILKWGDPETSKIRSKTFIGIAEAMAEQWG